MSQIHVAKLVLETQSPMAITTGERETSFDSALVRDMNGLPIIPATAIAGVWGHLAQHLPNNEKNYWFGSSEKSSVLSISNAVIHDQNNRPVLPFMAPEIIGNDSVLSVCALERPYHRERVSLNDRGVAKDTGKFDQIVLPKGVRFSLTVRWQHNAKFDHTALFALWNDRQMAFGASTRNGLGQVKVIASEIKAFNLDSAPEQAEQLQHYVFDRKVPTQLNEIASFSHDNDRLFASLPLQALDNWRCGSGSELLDRNSSRVQDDLNVAIKTYSEPSWTWKNNQANWVLATPVLCGSSIKGILAHRVAFHYRKHAGIWAETMVGENHAVWSSKPSALNQLFGYADEADHDASIAGILMVDDCPLSYEHTVIRHHNSIDRFTGGVRDGALFTEQLLYQPRFTVKVWLKVQRESLDKQVYQALLDALADLKNGLLPMGAGSGRGNSVVMADSCSPWVVNAQMLSVSEDVA